MHSTKQSSNNSSSIAQRFANVVSKTSCPYACKTNIRFAPEWEKSLRIEENIKRFLPVFDTFVQHEEQEALDMFVVEVCDVAFDQGASIYQTATHWAKSNQVVGNGYQLYEQALSCQKRCALVL